MITVCDIMFTNIKTKLYLREVYKKQSIIFGISLVVGLISCIPGVYASYLFNNGKQRYYSIITFAGNLGLATFGFYSLTF
jgi:ABC-type Mn2+/Zn2+ transport system permease subunit